MKYWTLIVFILLFDTALLATDTKSEVESEWTIRQEAGLQFAVGFVENGITRAQPYYEGGVRYDQTCSDESNVLIYYDASSRTIYDFALRKGRFELRSLFYSRTEENTALKIGYQEVSWGETFGFFIADMVNPRDLTDPLFNELAWIRLPTGMLNYQYFSEYLNVQFLVIPLPRNNWLPEPGNAFDVFPDALPGVPQLKPPSLYHGFFLNQTEVALRLNHLFKSGLDLSLIYFYHWNRNVVYQFVLHDDAIAIQPVEKKIHTWGCTFTKAFNDTVIRGDMVYHINTPFPSEVFGFPQRTNLWQSIFGIDRTNEYGLTLGGQYQLDAWNRGSLHAVSGLISKSLDDGQWNLEMFIYQGLGNNDRWIQPKVTWNSSNGWVVSLRIDLLWGTTPTVDPRKGILNPFRDKDRAFLWICKEW